MNKYNNYFYKTFNRNEPLIDFINFLGNYVCKKDRKVHSHQPGAQSGGYLGDHDESG